MARASKADAESTPTRRDEILAVAAQVVAERGIKGATVRDIGQAAGILSGSLYYHFESKEQIVLELLMPLVQEQYDRSVRIREAVSSPSEALSDFIRESVAETARHPNQSLILRNEARTFADIPTLAPLAEARRGSLALWLEVVKQGAKSGEFRSDIDHDVAVRAMFDGVLGAARWFSGAKPAKPDRVAKTLVALYVGGLKAT
jgi:AcrR family transcriptional regulator